MYEIFKSGNKDLSTYLQNKLNFQDKNITLVESKNEENADVIIRPERISDAQHLGSEFSQRNSGESI